MFLYFIGLVFGLLLSLLMTAPLRKIQEKNTFLFFRMRKTVFYDKHNIRESLHVFLQLVSTVQKKWIRVLPIGSSITFGDLIILQYQFHSFQGSD